MIAPIERFCRTAASFSAIRPLVQLDEGIGIAVRKEDEALRQRLNRALRAILDDGTYERINARYFPFSIYRSTGGDRGVASPLPVENENVVGEISGPGAGAHHR